MEEGILKRRSDLERKKITATSTDDGKIKQITSAAEFVPSSSGMPDLAMKQNPVFYTSAERPASTRASIPRVSDPIPFLKPKRQAVKQADVEADGGVGLSRRRIRFAENKEKDTDDGSSRSSGLVDYLSSDDEEPADGGAGPSRRSIQFAKTGEEKDRDGSASRSSGLVDYLSSDDEEQADGGAGPLRRRIRFAETDEEKDTDYGESRSSGLVDYLLSGDEEQADGEKEEGGSSSVTMTSMKRKREEAEVKEEMKPKKVLPPLPDAFLKLYPDEKRKSNPLHQCLVRATPHFPENRATHVYIEVTVNSDFRDLLARIVTTAQGPTANAVIHPVLDVGTHTDASSQSVTLHVSLSRCFFLNVCQRDRFAELLTKALEGEKSFEISFARIAHFTNKDWTRSFMGLEVGAGYNELLGCLVAVDDVVSKFGHFKYYNPPCFHVSVAWSLTLPPLLEGLTRVACVGRGVFERELRRHRVIVDHVWCKMGNRVVGLGLA